MNGQQTLNGDIDDRRNLPLVVDLDGTLTPTDTLIESVIRVVRSSPWSIVGVPLWLTRGRAGFKRTIAERAAVSAAHLPYRDALIDYLRTEKARGRRIILATAAHRSIAEGVSAHLGVFDDVLATDDGENLKGEGKLQSIRASVGHAFVYAGDSAADAPIWAASQGAVLVGVRSAVAAAVRAAVPIEREFPREQVGAGTWLRAIRLHQWLKNSLLFVPVLTSFSFSDIGRLGTMTVAFLSFSLAASGTYLANDLWDLEDDRVHPRKRLRPLASGAIPVLHGIAVAAALLLTAFLLAASVSMSFWLMLLVYVVLTSAYSLTLKAQVLVDVLMLSLLYTLRIVAGSVAVGITISAWLLAFSVFLFLSLALVKRCAELVALDQRGLGATRGRDYRVSDLVVLWPLGVGAALSAAVVFGLFISAPETQQRYATPELLWVVAIGFVYWLARIWIKTSRGEMHDDPVIFAIKDRGSRVTVLAMVTATLVARFLHWPS